MRSGWGWPRGPGEDQEAPRWEGNSPGSPPAARPTPWGPCGILAQANPAPASSIPALRTSHLLGQGQPRARVGGGGEPSRSWSPRVPRPRLSQEEGLCCLSTDQGGLSGQGSLPTPPFPTLPLPAPQPFAPTVVLPPPCPSRPSSRTSLEVFQAPVALWRSPKSTTP